MGIPVGWDCVGPMVGTSDGIMEGEDEIGVFEGPE